MNSNDDIHHLVENLQKVVRDLTTKLDVDNRHASLLLQRNGDLVNAYEAVLKKNKDLRAELDNQTVVLKSKASFVYDGVETSTKRLLEETEKQLERVEQTNNELRNNLRIANESRHAAENNAAAWKREYEDCERALAGLNGDYERVDQMLAEKGDENQKLSVSLGEARESNGGYFWKRRHDELTATHKTTIDKLDNLRAELADTIVERDRLASQLKAATCFNDEIYPQLTDLRRQFANRGRELELEQQQYRQLEAEYEELSTECGDLEASVQSLVSTRDELEEQLEALRPKRYSHACSLMFTVESTDPEGEDITNTMLYDSVTARVKEVAWLNQWDDACLPPVDSEEIA